MGIDPLFLSTSGLFRLPHNRQEQAQKGGWGASNALCIVSRDAYWENIAVYPTGNIIEVYKIIAAEINQISPLPGTTKAYIIETSKERTSVLYCCYSDQLIEKAKQFRLWRLIPESLPFFRSLGRENHTYLARATFAPVKIGENKTGSESSTPLDHSLVIRANNNKLSSLPYNKQATPPFSDDIGYDNEIISDTRYAQIVTRFRLLSCLDFFSHIRDWLGAALLKNKHLASYSLALLTSLVLTFIIGKSALVTWQHNSLTNEINSSKSDAIRSIELLNMVRRQQTDITKVNNSLSNHGPKSLILSLISQHTNEATIFTTINISPADIQLRGTTDSATDLLNLLNKIQGFHEVSFSHPPATLKSGEELFNIYISYDQDVYSNRITP